MTVTIDDAGISVEGPAALRIPWKRVRSVRDAGEAFLIDRALGPAVPILKRAMPDGGEALWAAFEAQLVGTRYLVRGAAMSSTLSNTAARS